MLCLVEANLSILRPGCKRKPSWGRHFSENSIITNRGLDWVFHGEAGFSGLPLITGLSHQPADQRRRWASLGKRPPTQVRLSSRLAPPSALEVRKPGCQAAGSAKTVRPRRRCQGDEGGAIEHATASADFLFRGVQGDIGKNPHRYRPPAWFRPDKSRSGVALVNERNAGNDLVERARTPYGAVPPAGRHAW